ncbi:MAG: AAA family ATPase [Bacteroidota bacterium]
MSTNTGGFQALFNQFFAHQLTDEQARLRDLLYEFSVDKDPNPVLVLSGYAGTGKTSMLGAYVKTLDHFQVKSKLLAPTGRAAKVLANRSKKEAFTIHKQIYRRKESTDEYSALGLMPNLHANTVFIVDEASMIPEFSVQKDGTIGRELLSDLIEYVFSGKNCKLIFLGDRGQLPPVGSAESPALNVDFLDRMFHQRLKLRSFTLTQVLRQNQSSAILDNATHLRSITFPEIYDFKFNTTDFIQLSGEFLQDELERCYNEFGAEETLVITRSNKRANLFNQNIRGRVLWYEEQLCQEDYLMVVKNNYFWLKDDSKAGFIANGELLKLKRILKYEEQYGFTFAKVRIAMVDYPEEDEFEVYLLIESLETEAPNVPRERLKELFFEIEKDYLHEKNKRKRYEMILKNPFFNALQVKYAYAVTCHKAQGGQWAAVFIDQGYVPEDQLNQEHYRWIYTAITRATERVYWLG